MELCDRPHDAHGYCRAHLYRFKKGIDLTAPFKRYPPKADRGAESAKRPYLRTIAERLAFYAPPAGEDECWPWRGGRRRGHGACWDGSKQRGAHCLAWELANSEAVPDNMVVRHKCDNGLCVNPNHLEIGTQEQNVLDMIQRGRYVPSVGFRHRTKRERAQIRELYAEGVTPSVLARIFGCSTGTIFRIVKPLKAVH